MVNGTNTVVNKKSKFLIYVRKPESMKTRIQVKRRIQKESKEKRKKEKRKKERMRTKRQDSNKTRRQKSEKAKAKAKTQEREQVKKLYSFFLFSTHRSNSFIGQKNSSQANHFSIYSFFFSI